MTKSRAPAWLTDRALERSDALGREVLRFIRRRKRLKQVNPSANVDIGARLRAMIARLEREEAAAGKIER
jgi:hypothetical protein